MFTLQQIKTIHSKVKTGADFPAYIKELKALGVTRYETFVFDSHTIYVGKQTENLASEPMYDALVISGSPDPGQFKKDLTTHQNGGSDYFHFCSDCARNGVEKWRVALDAMTCTYFDRSGNIVLVEQIPN
jgi:uncharacterized protein YbcV (DUF1398 family)